MSLFEGGIFEVDLVTTLFEVVAVLLLVVGLPILNKNYYLAHSVYNTEKCPSIHTRCIYRVRHSADVIGKSS